MTSPHPESEAMLFLPSAIVRLIGTFHCLDPRPAALAANSLMAERVGFEPTDRVNDQRFSRPPHSTTLAPLPFHERRASPARLIRRLHRMAERVGFEPTVEFPLHTLSRRAPSATRTPLRFFFDSMPIAAMRQRNFSTTQYSLPRGSRRKLPNDDSCAHPAPDSRVIRSSLPFDRRPRRRDASSGC